MSQEGLENIKAKLHELTNLIKEETTEEARIIKDGLMENVTVMKSLMGESFQETEQIFADNMHEVIGELETRALQVQHTIREKFSQGIVQKDEIVIKAADSLIETISKMKNALRSKHD
ncbi:MAG: hypothetical protein AWM53_01429 [Candidatus Dichloromethanomonas elyunquensis]|nr:MAG: hypothetical protein AWM53_01429 [Candidatus Dichloromethanomonas elyunquensis]